MCPFHQPKKSTNKGNEVPRVYLLPFIVCFFKNNSPAFFCVYI